MSNLSFESCVDEIVCGDCLEVMKDWPDNCISAIVTDPPFFTPATHYQSRIKHARSWGDMSILESWWSNICDELSRLCPLGHVMVFCNGESYPAFYKAMFPKWDKLKSIIWDKGHVGLGRIYRNQHELIIWARSEGHYLPDDGKLRADVITENATPSSKRSHPVEKPVPLLKQLICAPGDGVVFDPFCGSGTTCVAAKMLGHHYIGIDIDEKYCKIARMRIKTMNTGVPVEEQLKGQMGLFE